MPSRKNGKKRAPKSRFYKPKRRATRNKKIITGDELHEMIVKALRGRMASNFNVYIADDRYYLPPLADAQEIIRLNGVDREKYVAEKHDCDDFSLLLKAAFIQAAYKDGRRRYPYALCEVWGQWNGPHAFNMIMTEYQGAYLIEPQDDVIEELDAVDGVWFVKV